MNNDDKRQPPHNEEAEQALLGALLINNRAYDKVSDVLRPEHFYDPAHQRIFAAIAEAIDSGRTANPVTLKAQFEGDADLKSSGGAAYLVELAGNVITVVNAADYARTIHECFLRRQQIEAAAAMLEMAYDMTGPKPEEAIAQCAADLDLLLDRAPAAGAGFVTMRESVEAAIEQADVARRSGGGLSGISTGLLDMDRMTGGFQATDLIIIAGRPSMGKTTWAKNIAVHAAKQFKAGQDHSCPVGFFSLEMSGTQLAANYLAEETGIGSPRQRQGDLTDDDFLRLTHVDPDIPFFIDTSADTLPVLLSRARRMKRKHGVGLFIVDYLQLLTGAGQSENRVQELTKITRGLKKLARDLQAPVVALSQLSRQVEAREEKRPQLSDLRESGSIEQDADVVIFAFREQYYLERAEPSRRADESEEKYNDRYQRWQQRLGDVHNTAEFIIAKQRMGPIGVVKAYFDGNASKFGDLDTRH